MPFSKFFVALAVCGLLLPGPVLGAVYKHVDDNGKVTFSDKPPEGTDEVEIIKLLPDNNGFVPATVETSAAGSATNTDYSKASVELFVTSWCPWCRKAHDFLKSRGVPFREYNVEKDRRARQRFKELNPRGGVPMAIINGRVVLGFDEQVYLRALSVPD